MQKGIKKEGLQVKVCPNIPLPPKGKPTRVWILNVFATLWLSQLSLRCYNGQVGEALANVKVLNKMATLGMPVRQAVN